MSFTYLVGVFRQGTKQPLINVTVAEVDSSNVILNSAKTNSAGFAIIQPSDEEFIPKVLVSGNYVHDVDVIITGLGAGVGPFEYDYLVDANWATVVSAGRGSEGQSIPTFHGHTFKVFSTVQAAINDWESGGASDSGTIMVVEGDYPEKITVSESSHELHIHGTGIDGVTIGSLGTGAHNIGNSDVFLYNLTFGGSAFIGAVAQKSATTNMKIVADHVVFRGWMAGDHAGSEFYNCIFEAGWVAGSGDTPSGVKIIGGESWQSFDFVTNSVLADQFYISNFFMTGVGDEYKFYRLQRSVIEVLGPTSNPTGTAFSVSEGIRATTIIGHFRGPTSSDQLLHFTLDSNLQNDGVKIIAAIENGSHALESSRRFIKQDGTGIAEGWHVDCAFTQDGAGHWIEDDGGLSVEFDNAVGCKFTLVPHHKATLLINAGSNNVVDAGVIDGSSVGTDYATPGEHEHTGTGDGGNTLQPTNYKLPAATELTIATGAITVTQSHHTIDTEADAASDDLDTINGLVANQLYVLRPANDARTINLKHGTGNISCVNGSDITLDDVEDFVWALSTDGSTVYVLFDTKNTDGATIPIDISFVFADDALSAAVFVAPHGIAADLLALLTNANVSSANAFVYAETAGTGTNTILIETTSTNPWTGSPTWATVATLNLGTSKRATAAFSGTYNPTTQYLRARCSAVGGTAPQKVHARISALGVVA